jgi:hypothetical protein
VKVGTPSLFNPVKSRLNLAVPLPVKLKVGTPGPPPQSTVRQPVKVPENSNGLVRVWFVRLKGTGINGLWNENAKVSFPPDRSEPAKDAPTLIRLPLAHGMQRARTTMKPAGVIPIAEKLFPLRLYIAPGTGP